MICRIFVHLRILNDVTVVLCLLERKCKKNIRNSLKKKNYFLCDFKFTTCNTDYSLITTTNSTVTGAQFCYNNTLEHNTNNTIKHGSSQPSMQKQRSVWCTVDTAVQANI